jgi:hypothetical protein
MYRGSERGLTRCSWRAAHRQETVNLRWEAVTRKGLQARGGQLQRAHVTQHCSLERGTLNDGVRKDRNATLHNNNDFLLLLQLLCGQ